MEAKELHTRIRYLLVFFILGLIVSGITAFPLLWEVSVLRGVVGANSVIGRAWPAMSEWIESVHRGLADTSGKYPFILYGTDWLAFAHIIIAVAFWGPLRDPVKNVWVIEFGLIACALVIPTALICGALRGIPFFWRLLDCSFGIVGIVPLVLARQYVQRLKAMAFTGAAAG